MAIIFEGTFADLQAQLHSLPLRPEGRIRLESQETVPSTGSTVWQPNQAIVYSNTIEDIIAEQDEEDVRNACRIAGYQYPDRAA